MHMRTPGRHQEGDGSPPIDALAHCTSAVVQRACPSASSVMGRYTPYRLSLSARHGLSTVKQYFSLIVK
jgi:hypothetical protein